MSATGVLEPTLLVSRKNRETGTTVELWRALDHVPGYTLLCVEHSFVSVFERRGGETGAEAFLSHPKTEGWCEVCAGTYAETVDPGD